MNSKLLVAGLVSGIVGFLLGWVIYGMLLMDFMAAHTTVYAGKSHLSYQEFLLVIYVGDCSLLISFKNGRTSAILVADSLLDSSSLF